MNLSALWLIPLCCATAQAGPDQPVWITNVVLVSPEKLDKAEPGSVLVQGGRIVRVVRGKGIPKPAGAKVFSGKGQFLVPGLIDSHVHLASLPGLGSAQEAAMPAMVQAYLRQMPRSYLYYGYTALVDLAVVDLKLMNDFRSAPEHPDLFDCGGSLVFANGYPMSFIRSPERFAAFPNFVYDPAQAASIPPEYRPEEHSPEADVARVKASGGICVKTYFERGFGRDRNLPVMGLETLARIRAEATRDGLVLIMHANSLQAQTFAVQGGVDVIAHGLWNWGALNASKDLPPEVMALLDQIAAHGIGYQPTIQVLVGERAYFDPGFLDQPAVRKVVPPSMAAWFRSSEAQWFGKVVNEESESDEDLRKAIDGGPLRRIRQIVAYLATKNAHFLFGTDTPSAPTYGNLPGLNGYMEMQQLFKAGMSLRQIFRAATIENARAFRMEGECGSIEPGKLANLLLMKESPLSRPEAYDSITTVWVHGRAIRREDLAARPKTPE
jgi:imidazolonepropionase-like amidohydrolase